MDKEKVKLATALVNERTAQIELHTRRVQLLASLVKLATVFVGLVGVLAVLALRL